MNFLPILVIVLLGLLMFKISSKNYSNRTYMLKNNLKTYNEEFKKNFLSLPSNLQNEFILTLDEATRKNFNNFLYNDNYKYANNTWSLQKQMAVQQDFINSFNKWYKLHL